MKEIVLENLIDNIKLLPFLFLTFLLIELIEHKFTKKSKKVIKKAGKLGPFFGSILGIVPQCGFSVAATNLYATRIITLGTLFSVYLSTSDEMIPLLIAEKASTLLIIKILVVKITFSMILGFIIDFILRKEEEPVYNLCEKEHCHCNKNILPASIKHTINIFIFIVISTFTINILLEYLGIDYLKSIFL